MQTTSVDGGNFIFREGDSSSEAYRLLSGAVEITISAEGQPVVLAHLAPGDIFGEMAMIDERPRSASARTLETSEIEILTPEDFNQYIIQDPALLMPYLASFFERLRSTNERLRAELSKRVAPRSAPAASLERVRVPSPVRGHSVALPRRGEETAEPVLETELPASSPRVVLKVANAEVLSRCSQDEVVITKFPYRIGRAEHQSVPTVFSTNDFVLQDEKPYQLSRNHCSIECDGDHIYVRDRGSVVGTIVNGTALGAGESVVTADLNPGENSLILGMEASPYQFTVQVG